MPRLEDPSELTPQQRRREIAEILAAGVLRLRKLRVLAPGQPSSRPKTVAESSTDRLEVPGETVLSVRSG